MRHMAGPFVVETVHPEWFISPYRTWLPSDPEKVWEFKNARELENFFQAVCAQSETGAES
jgi:hypothetical protein